MQTVQEVYQNNILPLSEKDRLRLVALIVDDISHGRKGGEAEPASGKVREMFGTCHSGDRNGSDNERIDADLALAYADDHEEDE